MANVPDIYISEILLANCKQGQLSDRGYLVILKLLDPLQWKVNGCVAVEKNTSLVDDWLHAQEELPAGYHLSGIYFTLQSEPTESQVEDFCISTSLPDYKNFLQQSYVLVFGIWKKEFHPYWFFPETGSVTAARVVKDQPHKPLLTFRLQANIPLQFDYSTRKDVFEDNMYRCIYHMQSSINSGMTVYGTDSFLCTDEHKSGKCSDLSPDTIKGKKKGQLFNELIPIQMYLEMSGKTTHESLSSSAPIINHQHHKFRAVMLSLPIDVLMTIEPSQSLKIFHDLLSSAVCQQLIVMSKVLLKYRKEDTFHLPMCHHFHPALLGHYVTVIYPKDVSDDQLVERRTELHRKFCLPMDKPCLRRSAALFQQQINDGYLRNPHLHLPQQSTDGICALVQGSYVYHHYMQDNMNDNGWGCAYRSLQTLVSWFRLQGYCSVPTPSHSQIQQVLVDIGDKERSFLGSKQWIGSTEVSFVIENLLGVTSKILCVNSGEEMAGTARQLINHFQVQGTPVMIGGGVLAHTIIGIHFNETTGAVKFLILDPHYTGSEDLKTILDKGWCGWKSVDFWDKRAFYNLCLPQRPNTI